MKQKTAEWTPKQGEKVWIKVFDNWSEGTYIGYDTIKEKYLAREDENIGGLLLASPKVLPYNSNPNKIKHKTAMMELIDFLWKYKQAGINEPDAIKEKAKMLLEKEKEQIMDAFNEGEDNIDENGKMIGKIDAEDYYNQTYLEKRKQ